MRRSTPFRVAECGFCNKVAGLLRTLPCSNLVATMQASPRLARDFSDGVEPNKQLACPKLLVAPALTIKAIQK
ncbi:MAG: hypothetical protein E5X80_06395 [Mesorhizobium sp.]|uniref:hypothetical protein n=1 Tax=Mesorhizobium sp. TaxID=1871066 RepID=UPI000FE6D6C4|nr:hypothetical protein [Mesorhizobium sp.]RWM08977.1 MAG: hypothetical protein EOR71_10715 [Mesorhizobium sp.]TIO52652.1 MAG: hypothetical protein E5X78_11560 [Mesorhizobium sp.]TIO61701.1 MAG: hypothetical protein E5X79_06490 [Mesorhizobium sp.]TJV66403.1 MAG: hypothetical protein E5X80_06395 [Mesorhizobium sp.]